MLYVCEADFEARLARPRYVEGRLLSGMIVQDDEHEHLRCRVCMALCDRPVTTPCQHNYCLSCFRKWVNQEKNKCPTCRAIVPASMVHNPRINTMLAGRVRLAQKVRIELQLQSHGAPCCTMHVSQAG